jgi:L-Ala-D/L-Glu epimerase
MGTIREIRLRWLDLPLTRPYRLSYRTFENFEPFMVEVLDDAGNRGFGDGHISPGSSAETRDGGWQALQRWCRDAVGRSAEEAKTRALAEFETSKVAATALVTSLEVLEGDALSTVAQDAVLPLLTPVNETAPDRIPQEIEQSLSRGFRTFKVKVGKDVDADLARVEAIQSAVRDRATLRLDANRAYGRDDAIRFVTSLKPDAIELFEQPCDADDWDANAAVAAASDIPLMLDEPICSLEDIERASDIRGVGFCKLKLKRFGGLEKLRRGLDTVRSHGMKPVLGDGLGSELHSWLEACVASRTIDNAGEFNGFLKPRDRLFHNPLRFQDGAIHLPAGYRPELDLARIEGMTIRQEQFRN